MKLPGCKGFVIELLETLLDVTILDVEVISEMPPARGNRKRQAICDVAYRITHIVNGEAKSMVVIVEMQNYADPQFLVRLDFYAYTYWLHLIDRGKKGFDTENVPEVVIIGIDTLMDHTGKAGYRHSFYSFETLRSRSPVRKVLFELKKLPLLGRGNRKQQKLHLILDFIKTVHMRTSWQEIDSKWKKYPHIMRVLEELYQLGQEDSDEVWYEKIGIERTLDDLIIEQRAYEEFLTKYPRMHEMEAELVEERQQREKAEAEKSRAEAEQARAEAEKLTERQQREKAEAEKSRAEAEQARAEAEKRKLALLMLAYAPIEIVARDSGLSIEELQQLQKEAEANNHSRNGSTPNS